MHRNRHLFVVRGFSDQTFLLWGDYLNFAIPRGGGGKDHKILLISQGITKTLKKVLKFLEPPSR